MRLLFIAGHGATDPGAVSTIGGVQYREATETRAVVEGVTAALRGYAEIAVYDTSRNAFADHQAGTLKSRAEFSKYDYVLEVHFNASVPDAGDGKTKGVECYVTTASQEGAAAEAIVKAVSALGLQNRGVKRKNWSVIAAAQAAGVPAALLEVCFLDDADDMRVYTAKKQQIAKAIADGLIQRFGLRRAQTTAASVVTGNTAVGGEDMQTIYKTLKDVPDWARPTVNKLLEKGLLQGDGEDLNLEHHMLRGLVINDRAGLYS